MSDQRKDSKADQSSPTSESHVIVCPTIGPVKVHVELQRVYILLQRVSIRLQKVLYCCEEYLYSCREYIYGCREYPYCCIKCLYCCRDQSADSQIISTHTHTRLQVLSREAHAQDK
ncbi:hypothetical protein HELRODRAFT_166210 [Helobdella robusta]|uniref:Uncharacterized protein n=1 Tax=Helobdella robusta TaxID=6412 RepID=T1EXW7_HELRO|nr:hypothetical protein HELRODRAFT_166210 [Helobdella robusta]ESN90536.1 hypothetical protein HELRODRAFT_166210 [Helobdella robusta]